jgi:hypothetical protein
MSDETIRKGDLVQVVRPMPCCGLTTYIGWIFTAHSDEVLRAAVCANCLRYRADQRVVHKSAGTGYPREILKKIPPLTEPVTVNTDNEVHA